MLTIRLRHGDSYLKVNRHAGPQVVTGAAWMNEADLTVHPSGLPLQSGQRISLRAHTGLYLQAVGGGGSQLNATGMWCKTWEQFTILRSTGEGAIRHGDQVVLRTHTGHWVSHSGITLSAATTDRNAATSFTVELLDQRPPLNMVVLGDSVAWGQGLKEQDKYDTKVGQWLQGQLGRPVFRYRYAHSGATVLHDNQAASNYTDHYAPLIPGELPYSNPAIHTQVEIARQRLALWHHIPADQVNFVLMDGGINTVGVTNIINPVGTIEDLIAKTRKAGADLRETVSHVLQTFPNARVALTNYFPIISTHANLGPLEIILGLFHPWKMAVTLALRGHLANMSNAFHQEMTAQMRAIAAANPGRVVLAESGFTGEHAFGTANSLLWGVGGDDVQAQRKVDCGCHPNTPPYCDIASISHPNRAGAARYADSITQAIQPWLPVWEGTRLTIDAPAAGAAVRTTTTIRGWAIDRNSPTGTGVSQVQVYLNGPAGVGTLLGTATYGQSRPDVDRIFNGGGRYLASGWELPWDTTTVSEGRYSLWVRAFSTATQAWGPYTPLLFRVDQLPFADDPRVTIEAPMPGTITRIDGEPELELVPSVKGMVTVRGWAVDRNALSGPGISKIQFYLDGPAGQGRFLGEAVYGESRPDRAQEFGSQFLNCGWRFEWNSRRSPLGQHTLYVHTHSAVTGRSNIGTIPVNVLESDYAADPRITVDEPAAEVRYGMVTIRGWAVDRNALHGTGIKEVQVFLNGQAGKGGLFLGHATYGQNRPDVASHFGEERLTNSGWSINWDASRLQGDQTLYIYAWSIPLNQFRMITRKVRILPPTFANDPLIAVDGPTEGTHVSGTVTVRGWAIDRNAPQGTGVDQVHLYLNGHAGAGTFLGAATYGLSRPDVASAHRHTRFTNSGWQLSWNTSGLKTGDHTLYIYAHSTDAKGWYLHATRNVKVGTLQPVQPPPGHWMP